MKEKSTSEFKYDQAIQYQQSAPYNQKDERDSVWSKNTHGREDPKSVQHVPLLTSQVYGWREPIDNMRLGFNRSGVCKKTFHDHGHLS